MGLLIFLSLFLFVSTSIAHQLRIDSGTISIENPIIVENPEISQAFYGQLKGNPVYYKITSNQPFQLYLNLLVPTSPGQGGEPVSAEVTDSSGNIVMFLNGTNSTRTPYFEEFGGDYYLKGPEATKDVPAGIYIIKVFNNQNQGKYSLAVGKIEAFPLNETLNALVTLPILKEQFFAKPVTKLFLEFLGIILALGSLMSIFILFIRSRKSIELTEMSLKVGSSLSPVLWLGTIITLVIWVWVLYSNPFNILGIVNSLILVLILILTFLVGRYMMKAEFGKLPLKSMTFLVIFWWIFVFLAISVI
jgi:hypothetical protein